MSTRAGRVGDLIAAAIIELHGGDAVIARTDGFDILAFIRDRFFRIEVKSRSKADSSRSYQFIVGKGGKGKRRITRLDADAIALVAIDRRLVVFKRIEEVTGLTMRMSARHFTAENESLSFRQVMLEGKSSACSRMRPVSQRHDP